MMNATNNNSGIRKIFAGIFAVCVVLSMSVCAFAAESTPVDVDGLLNGVTGALGDFSTGNLTKILIAGVSIAAGLVLLWFGFNYVKRKLMGALRKGKM